MVACVTLLWRSSGMIRNIHLHFWTFLNKPPSTPPSHRAVPTTGYRKGQRNTANFYSNPVFFFFSNNSPWFQWWLRIGSPLPQKYTTACSWFHFKSIIWWTKTFTSTVWQHFKTYTITVVCSYIFLYSAPYVGLIPSWYLNTRYIIYIHLFYSQIFGLNNKMEGNT